MNGSLSRDSLRSKVAWHAKSVGGTLAVVGAVIGMVVFVGGESVKSNAGVIVAIGCHWVVLVHLAWCLLQHECPTYYGNPTVRNALRKRELLIVEPSPWLGYGVATSVFVAQDDLELLVCTGRVVNVQLNELVQIEVDSGSAGMESADEVWQVLENERNSLIIRPGLDPRSFPE